MATYKMVQIPPNIHVQGTGRTLPNASTAAAEYLESVVNPMAAQGWEFQRVDAIAVKSSPGCLGALFGQRETLETYYVVTFRKD
jgi:tRNA A37 threonylcarbamoyltransferase TsaD